LIDALLIDALRIDTFDELKTVVFKYVVKNWLAILNELVERLFIDALLIEALDVLNTETFKNGVVAETGTIIFPPTFIVVPFWPILIMLAFTFPIPNVVPAKYTSIVGVVKLI
jgi:hypothetical protein